MRNARKRTEADAETLGGLLAAARLRRDLPLEKVAQETRIRVQRLREIESNDFSQFAHPSYARMFLTDYARYLDLPLAEIRHLLPERGECGAEGYQYLGGNSCDVATMPSHRPKPRRRLLPALAAATVIVALGLGGFKLWKLKGNIDRLGLASPGKSPAASQVTEPAAPSVANTPSEGTEAHSAPASLSPENHAPLVAGKKRDEPRIE